MREASHLVPGNKYFNTNFVSNQHVMDQ